MQNLKRQDVDSAGAVQPKAEPAARPSAPFGLADGSQQEVASPARTLQQRLVDDLNAAAVEDDGYRWAPRTTLVFSFSAALALWAAIALGIAAFR